MFIPRTSNECKYLQGPMTSINRSYDKAFSKRSHRSLAFADRPGPRAAPARRQSGLGDGPVQRGAAPVRGQDSAQQHRLHRLLVSHIDKRLLHSFTYLLSDFFLLPKKLYPFYIRIELHNPPNYTRWGIYHSWCKYCNYTFVCSVLAILSICDNY